MEDGECDFRFESGAGCQGFLGRRSERERVGRGVPQGWVSQSRRVWTPEDPRFSPRDLEDHGGEARTTTTRCTTGTLPLSDVPFCTDGRGVTDTFATEEVLQEALDGSRITKDRFEDGFRPDRWYSCIRYGRVQTRNNKKF